MELNEKIKELILRSIYNTVSINSIPKNNKQTIEKIKTSILSLINKDINDSPTFEVTIHESSQDDINNRVIKCIIKMPITYLPGCLIERE